MTSEVKGYLGFANLPNQVHRKSVKKGFEFTLMVVGESGLGKSTLVNCLFYSQLYKNRKIPMVQDTLESTVKITASNVDIEERGVKLKLTVVDTPGYGEGIDSKDCTEPIISYIDDQYEKYLQHESGLNRRQIADTRIHCCFYFISPVGYGLKPIDVHFLKRLHKKVNIIPLIGKSDALTKEEIKVLKKNILAEIEANEISIYTIPDADEDEEEDFKEQIKQVKASIPFAVSSSLDSHEVKGRKVQGRLYPWGVVETENPDHSDFVKLRSLLVTHMQDLREVTQEVHYENYRSLRLAGGGLSGANSGVISMDNISLNQSEDGEETSRMLQEKEAELRRMEEMLAKMRQQMQQQGFQQEDHCNGQGMNGSTRV